MKSSDDDVRQLLREWCDVPAAPDFVARIEHEIAQRAARAGRWNWTEGAMGIVRTWPRLASVCVAIGVVLGVAGVEWRAARTRAREAREMPTRYLRWIDPVAPNLETRGRP